MSDNKERTGCTGSLIMFFLSIVLAWFMIVWAIHSLPALSPDKTQLCWVISPVEYPWQSKPLYDVACTPVTIRPRSDVFPARTPTP